MERIRGFGSPADLRVRIWNRSPFPFSAGLDGELLFEPADRFAIAAGIGQSRAIPAALRATDLQTEREMRAKFVEKMDLIPGDLRENEIHFVTIFRVLLGATREDDAPAAGVLAAGSAKPGRFQFEDDLGHRREFPSRRKDQDGPAHLELRRFDAKLFGGPAAGRLLAGMLPFRFGPGGFHAEDARAG